MNRNRILVVSFFLAAVPLFAQTIQRVDPRVVATNPNASQQVASMQLIINSIHSSCLSKEFTTLSFQTTTGLMRFDFPCYPYTCGGTAKACLTTCGGNGDCASGFACSGGHCVLPTPTCNSDMTASVNAFGKKDDCYPLNCNAVTGLCQQRCRTSADCAVGTACVIDQGICTKP